MDVEKFAKLYEFDDIGQVLVIADAKDDGRPCVVFVCAPPGLGLCNMTVAFDDTDAGWERRDDAFAKMTEQKARDVAIASIIEPAKEHCDDKSS